MTWRPACEQYVSVSAQTEMVTCDANASVHSASPKGYLPAAASPSINSLTGPALGA
jgi:hypothetical protein